MTVPMVRKWVFSIFCAVRQSGCIRLLKTPGVFSSLSRMNSPSFRYVKVAIWQIFLGNPIYLTLYCAGLLMKKVVILDVLPQRIDGAVHTPGGGVQSPDGVQTQVPGCGRSPAFVSPMNRFFSQTRRCYPGDQQCLTPAVLMRCTLSSLMG